MRWHLLRRGRDPGTIESARRTTEDLLARFGLEDAEFTRLDLDPTLAADAVLASAIFSRDEQLELRPLCRELLVCFYRSLPEKSRPTGRAAAACASCDPGKPNWSSRLSRMRSHASSTPFWPR